MINLLTIELGPVLKAQKVIDVTSLNATCGRNPKKCKALRAARER
jgi:hypothetical protein